MYRSYENPHTLEDQLTKVKADYAAAMEDPDADDTLLMDLAIEIHEMENCHGCKYLDEVKKDGSGYCCMVVRSKDYAPGMRVRKSDSCRCELFTAGDFKTRHSNK